MTHPGTRRSASPGAQTTPPGTRRSASPHESRIESTASSSNHRGWHRRGFLPHLDAVGTYQSITYRLIDSLPKDVLARFQQEILTEPAAARQRQLRHLIETYADAGHGSCVLRQEAAARIVVNSWQFLDGEAYDLHAWVVMPNHVHVLIRQRKGILLERIVARWKSFTATTINKSLERRGPLWMADYWDRYIRDETHYQRVIHYIEHNPVSAGLVAVPQEWPWSSAPKT